MCAVTGCHSRSDREKHSAFFRLPLSNKPLLAKWVANIGRKDLPGNANTRICSLHFKKGKDKTRVDIPTLELGRKPVYDEPSERKPPKSRTNTPTKQRLPKHTSIAVGTDLIWETRILELTAKVDELEGKLASTRARTLDIDSVLKDDNKVQFYTGFPSKDHLQICFEFLGPAVNCLQYWKANNTAKVQRKKCGRQRKLSPLEEFFLTLCRLRLGLLEEDLADRFGIHVSTVSRIFITWVNFLYQKFKQIPLWPSRSQIQQHMPDCFRKKYPTTRTIVDATEIRVVQPSDPIEQQQTFSHYKNTNTFKALIGITPSGAVSFVSSLYSGNVSDKELFAQSGILGLLEKGDSVMADRGFDVHDLLQSVGVELNIPPYLSGRPQLDEPELVETRRIASLRIHVERAIERIKNYHFFDRPIPSTLVCITDQAFYVCAVLTNFYPPLVL